MIDGKVHQNYGHFRAINSGWTAIIRCGVQRNGADNLGIALHVGGQCKLKITAMRQLSKPGLAWIAGIVSMYS